MLRRAGAPWCEGMLRPYVRQPGAAIRLCRAGASALGVGSALINQRLLDEGDFGALTERAGRFIEEVAQGRGL